MRLHSACVALLLLSSAASLGRPQEPPPTPVFPARADLVLLDLVVRDKAGRLVEDLRTDEVQVLEDGKPCAVAVVPPRAGGRRNAPRRAEPRREAGRPPAAKPAEPARPPVRRRPGRRRRPRLRPARPGGGEERAGGRAPARGSLLPEGLAVLGLQGRAGPPGPAVVHRGPEEPARRRSRRRRRASTRPATRRGRAGYDNATEEAFSLARDAQAAAKATRSRRAVPGDAGPDAPLHRLRDARGPGPGLAPAAPRDRARALARPGPEVAPLLLRGPRRAAGGRGALPDDGEHGQPVERLGLRVRRAGAARPLALGGDEAGARPRPRDRLLRAESAVPCPTRPCRRWRIEPSGDGAATRSASTGRASCGTSPRARAASSWRRRTTCGPGSSA